MKFSIKDFLSKCDQIRRKLRIWSHLLKKSLMETSFLEQWWYVNFCFMLKLDFVSNKNFSFHFSDFLPYRY